LLVEIAPPSLRDANRGIAHVREHRPEKVRRDDEVGVEERDELRVRVRHPVREGAALEARAIAAVDVLDVESLRPVARDERARELDGVVRGIVEQLNREKLAWIVEVDRGFNESPDDVSLV